jgi:hypothetical protein
MATVIFWSAAVTYRMATVIFWVATVTYRVAIGDLWILAVIPLLFTVIVSSLLDVL